MAIHQKLRNVKISREVKELITDKIIPQLPKYEINPFFATRLEHTLRHSPSLEEWHAINRILPRIPEIARSHFFQYHLPPVLHGKPTSEQWKIIEDILPSIPEQYRQNFFQYVFPTALTHSRISEKMREIIETVVDELRSSPEPSQVNFVEKLAPTAIENTSSSEKLRETLQAVNQVLQEMPEHARVVASRHALQVMLSQKPTPDEVKKAGKTINELLTVIPREHHLSFLEESLPDTLSNSNLQDLERHAQIAKEYLGEQTDHFMSKIVAENFGRLMLRTRLNSKQKLRFRKTGSQLIPLTGRFTGKMFRIIDEQPFTAWKHAHDNMPVEPILKVRKLKDGRMLVLTRYVGMRTKDFIKIHSVHREEVERLEREAIAKLAEIGVDHVHLHDQNIVVELVDGKPVVRIIDFDQAKQTRTNPDYYKTE